ncbi:MAG: hypothetical protein ACLP7P_08530 [Rhodomicrobium sp.]
MTRIHTLELRYERILRMQREDKNRFKPNPRGEGYLTRNERYQELIWQIEPVLRKEYQI